MKLPRFYHRIYAKLNGYFWLPCPICGEKFGGHENTAFLAMDWYRGVQVCTNCEDEAEQRNRDLKPPARKPPYSVERMSDTEVQVRLDPGLKLEPGEVAICPFAVSFSKAQSVRRNGRENKEES